MIVLAGISALQVSAQSLTERIGVCTALRNVPQLQKAGCSYVEIGISSFLIPTKSDSEFASNLAEIKASALPVLSGNGFFPGDIRLTGPDVDMKKIVAYGEIAIRRAKEAGLKTMVLGSSKARNIPDGFSREKAEKQFVAICKKLGKIAKRYDIYIALEPLQPSETNFMNTVTEGAAIAKKVNSPYVGVNADFFHMMRSKEQPKAIVDAAKYIKHCHIAELAGRTPPGTDGDDFRPFFRALRQINYQGEISIEAGWKNFDTQVVTAVAEMKRQIKEVEQE